MKNLRSKCEKPQKVDGFVHLLWLNSKKDKNNAKTLAFLDG
jgi:hypothetical protein